jgi:hypothetical protein
VANLVGIFTIHTNDHEEHVTVRDFIISFQEFLLCIEMFLISLAHMWAFGWNCYRKKVRLRFIIVIIINNIIRLIFLSQSQDDFEWTTMIPCYDFFCCCCCCCQVLSNFTGVVSQKDLIDDR